MTSRFPTTGGRGGLVPRRTAPYAARPATVGAAVARSATAMARRGPPATKYTEAERQAWADEQAAHRALQSHFSSFPVGRVCAANDNGRAKIVLSNPTTGVPDVRSKAVIEMAAFRAVPGGQSATGTLAGEGNCGQGDYAPTRGEAKRSFGLAMGGADESAPVDPKIAADQEANKQVVIEASRAALGAWFDTTATEECAGGVAAAYAVARSSMLSKLGAPTPAEVIRKEKSDPAVRDEVLALARQAFIDGGVIPFGVRFDSNGVELPPTAWVTSNAWSMLPGVYNPSLGKDRDKGPSVKEVPVGVENMPRLLKRMKRAGYQFHAPKYTVGKKREVIEYPSVFVPDTDEYGVPLLDTDGKPKMLKIDDPTFNPLFVAPTGELLHSLVQCSVILSLTTGGQKGAYGVKLLLAGSIHILDQAERKTSSVYHYDPELEKGLFKRRAPEPVVEAEEEVEAGESDWADDAGDNDDVDPPPVEQRAAQAPVDRPPAVRQTPAPVDRPPPPTERRAPPAQAPAERPPAVRQPPAQSAPPSEPDDDGLEFTDDAADDDQASEVEPPVVVPPPVATKRPAPVASTPAKRQKQ